MEKEGATIVVWQSRLPCRLGTHRLPSAFNRSDELDGLTFAMDGVGLSISMLTLGSGSGKLQLDGQGTCKGNR